jgi:Domain of unknown function (DUF4407)
MMSKLEQRFHQLQDIVLALSGRHEEVLALTPSERARFESLGWAILITSGVATVSMWFALSSAVGINGILALPVALAWGLVIMGIDRWLIVSMPAVGRRKFAIAAPRLALALLLGTLISTPLVLRIFQSEINAQIAKMQQQNYNTFLQQQQASDVAKQVSTYSSELQYLNTVIATHGATTANTASDPELKAYNQQLTNLDGELNHWTNLKNQYYTDYICQLYGGPTCPKKGFGPAAKDSLKNYQDASQEVNTLKGQINYVQGEIQQRDAQLSSNSAADQQARYQQALAQQPIVKNEYDTALQRQNELQATFFANNQAAHGILIRLEALSQLSNGNFTVTAARFLLFLLFLVIECLPVTVKLLQRPGLYEEGLQYAQEAERRDIKKFYLLRSRFIGPNGTAVLPGVLLEPGNRVEAIWNPPRALPGSVISEDDQSTEVMDDSDPAGAPGAHVEYWPAGGQVSSDPPEQRWWGPDRWRNNWNGRPAEDEPQVGAARQDAYGMAGPGDRQTRADYGPVAEAPRVGHDWHDRGQEEPYSDRAYLGQAHRDEDDPAVVYDGEGQYGSDGWRVESYADEGSQDPGTRDPGTRDPGTRDPGTRDPGTRDPGTRDPGTRDPGTRDPGTRDPGTRDPGTRDEVWYDDTAGRPLGGQAPAPSVPPGTGGAPLNWDEDE